ncbi:ABC transporter ATP-binding protein [Egbenema bharatensis]|uniref:ABC transporter ATP-binding protein n=1 Tax=Egbenema bharatensis TaxID=3463334 RepID=UPI003A8916A9
MLQIEELRKAYGQRVILNNLNLHIRAGEIYGLLGSNGAGKTTTINILCHLLVADSGRILIKDQPISESTKLLIGVVPQENLLYKSLTCEENLNFFAQIYGLSRAERKQRVEQCLGAVGLADRAKSPAEILSGGMQRRLSMAITLIHQPKLLILDEPTTGLDLEARYEIWDLIRKLQQQGMTILLSTHFLDEAERLCHRIGILKQGQIAAEGSLDELRQLIPASEILVVQTPEEEQVIQRATALGFPMRRYGHELAFWLPKHLELRDIITYFDGIPLDSIARQPARLEHIYREIIQKQDNP